MAESELISFSTYASIYNALISTYFPSKLGYEAIPPKPARRRGAKQPDELAYKQDMVSVPKLYDQAEAYEGQDPTVAAFKFTDLTFSGLFLGHQFCSRNATKINEKEKKRREAQEKAAPRPLCIHCRSQINLQSTKLFGDNEPGLELSLCQHHFAAFFQQADNYPIAMCARCGGAKQVLKSTVKQGPVERTIIEFGRCEYLTTGESKEGPKQEAATDAASSLPTSTSTSLASSAPAIIDMCQDDIVLDEVQSTPHVTLNPLPDEPSKTSAEPVKKHTKSRVFDDSAEEEDTILSAGVVQTPMQVVEEKADSPNAEPPKSDRVFDEPEVEAAPPKKAKKTGAKQTGRGKRKRSESEAVAPRNPADVVPDDVLDSLPPIPLAKRTKTADPPVVLPPPIASLPAEPPLVAVNNQPETIANFDLQALDSLAASISRLPHPGSSSAPSAVVVEPTGITTSDVSAIPVSTEPINADCPSTPRITLLGEPSSSSPRPNNLEMCSVPDSQPQPVYTNPIPATHDDTAAAALNPDATPTTEPHIACHSIYATPHSIEYWNGVPVSGCREAMIQFSHIPGVFIPSTAWPAFDNNRIALDRRESQLIERETRLFDRESELVKRERKLASQHSSSSSHSSSSTRKPMGQFTFSTENETEIERLERLRDTQRSEHQKLKEREDKVTQRERFIKHTEDDIRARESKLLELDENLRAKADYINEAIATRQAKLDSKAEEQRQEGQKMLEERALLDARHDALSIEAKKLELLKQKIQEELQKKLDSVIAEKRKLEEEVKKQTVEKKVYANQHDEAVVYMKGLCANKKTDATSRKMLEDSNELVALASDVYRAGVARVKAKLKSLNRTANKVGRPPKSKLPSPETAKADLGTHAMIHADIGVVEEEVLGEEDDGDYVPSEKQRF